MEAANANPVPSKFGALEAPAFETTPRRKVPETGDGLSERADFPNDYAPTRSYSIAAYKAIFL